MVNDIFIACAKKDWRILPYEERWKLRERKNLLNDQFIFTDDIIQKIKDLNFFLKEEEHRIRTRVNQIHQQQEQMRANGIIDDYEIDVELRLWNFSGYYTALDEDVFEGNPFFIDRTFCQYDLRSEDDSLFTGNWNFLSPMHPLGNVFFCYMFHAIYDHMPLAWEDILRIEELDMCVEVTNHFESKIQ